MIDKKGEKCHWNHVHYQNIGVLWVPEQEERKSVAKNDIIDSFDMIKRF